jgi:fibronectin type 3 domain-containing protein
MIDIPPEAGEYFYKVATETLDGVTGPLSEPVGVLFTNNLPAPVNVVAEDFGTFVEITWNEVADADNYTVHRANSASGPDSQIGSSDDPLYTDTPQTAGGYYYKVKAADTLGHESPMSFYAYTYFTDLPQAPFNVSAEDLSYRVRVSWESIDSSFIFIVYRSGSANGDYSPIDTVEGFLEFTDWPANAGHFYYKVRAEHPSHGSSELSEYGHVYFSGLLDTPTNLVATSQGSYIAISWNAVEGASEYEVFRGINESQLDSIQIVYVPQTTDVPDSAGTYYYAVLAKTEGGLESPRSAPVGVVFNP